MSGFVHLVGAGPGDPGLLTVAGRRALEAAEVVVHDRLGTERLLPLCPPSAELVNAGKAPGRQAMTQEEINAALVEHGLRGRRVVRLKGGDPFVFGRGGEEAEALAAAGVPYAVVPGITSAIAAPAYAGIPVTHRGLSTSFTVVTGHEDPGKPSEQTDWAALARVPGTLVILMGMGRLAAIAEALVAGGRPPHEPAAAVQWGTTARQRSVVGTLGDIASRVREEGLGSPAVVVIGPVAGLAERIGWIGERPLTGRTVVVTRARVQASDLSERLRALGADVVELPVIRIAQIEDAPGLEAALEGLGDYGLVVLTSVNGVDALFARLAARGGDARRLSPAATVVAIGPATAERLAAHGVRADVVPERFVAEGILEALAATELEGVRTLVARARGSRPALVEGLAARGAVVDEVELYEAVAQPADPAALGAALGAGHITFTASSTVRSFMALLDADGRAALAAGPRVVSIGPVTSATAREEGLEVHAEAAEHTIPGLVAALLDDVAAARGDAAGAAGGRG
ncbi:uroporphyrinogen-III C-methyltransferase [Miltoncostaea marina]|uniref:uroporphyrinogen-III C-methyltransferase n=1 Tax=Miltoncostaea marina TaxID=2843215 RepID=UPI001C3E4AC5|nr:uroporphyrinogen-III C-methyltransferase [Miltoncostaea marina]